MTRRFALTLALAALPLTLAGTSPADAKGCLKGAVVGGIAGHYAGHHAIAGAAGGCLVGHHLAKKHAQARQARP